MSRFGRCVYEDPEEVLNNSWGSRGDLVKDAVSITHALSYGVPDSGCNEATLTWRKRVFDLWIRSRPNGDDVPREMMPGTGWVARTALDRPQKTVKKAVCGLTMEQHGMRHGDTQMTRRCKMQMQNHWELSTPSWHRACVAETIASSSFNPRASAEHMSLWDFHVRGVPTPFQT